MECARADTHLLPSPRGPLPPLLPLPRHADNLPASFRDYLPHARTWSRRGDRLQRPPGLSPSRSPGLPLLAQSLLWKEVRLAARREWLDSLRAECGVTRRECSSWRRANLYADEFRDVGGLQSRGKVRWRSCGSALESSTSSCALGCVLLATLSSLSSRLSLVARVSVDPFSFPSAGITSLSARVNFELELGPVEELDLPFQLSHLQLHPLPQTLSPQFLAALARQPSLTSLVSILDDFFLPDHPASYNQTSHLIPSLILVAPQLVTL